MSGCCPKCGGWSVYGPYYRGPEDTTYGKGERLVYLCAKCGYEQSTPCLDAKPTK